MASERHIPLPTPPWDSTTVAGPQIDQIDDSDMQKKSKETAMSVEYEIFRLKTNRCDGELPQTMDRNRILNPGEIEGLIANGHTIVIYDNNVLRLDSWLHRHPGGPIAIQHMIGRDATDEINVYHFPRTIQHMHSYRIGRIVHPWSNLVPPLHGGLHRRYSPDNIAIDAAEDKMSRLCCDMPVCSNSNIASSTIRIEQENSEESFKGEKSRATTFSKDPKSVQIGLEGEEFVFKSHLDSSWKNLSRRTETSMLEQREVDKNTLAYPSLDLELQHNISLEYRDLHERIKLAGFYTCRYSEYGKDAIRWAFLFGLFAFFLWTKWYLTSAVFLGMFWQQIMFVAHDAGHRGITGNFVIDTLIGAFIADFCCGLSIGWWKSSHNVHHLVTNMPEHDPDLQNIPLFATSPSYLKSFTSTFYNFEFVCDSTADFLVQYQKWTYYPIMALARFNLYTLSWLHLMSSRSQNLGSASWTRPVEIAMIAYYWIWFGYGLVWCTLPTWPVRIGYVLICHGVTMLLHVQITLSHWGMPTSNLGPMESFAQHQLRTTMDVDCPAWLDFLHGGLQFQAVHHLFPRVPRHNLRELQGLVRDFCRKTQIEYKCHGFIKGNKIVVSRLEEVAKMAEMLVRCQIHMTDTGWPDGQVKRRLKKVEGDVSPK